MTEKQKEFVKKICDVLDYNFEELKNMNVKEASKFIEENLYEYNQELRDKRK